MSKFLKPFQRRPRPSEPGQAEQLSPDQAPSAQSGPKQTPSVLSSAQSKKTARSLAQQSSAYPAASTTAPLSRPLLHILRRDEMPGDMVLKPKQAILQGQQDVYITRAEIELKKAMQSLVFLTHAEINSLETLAALSLPRSVAPLFWTINALLRGKYSNLEDPNQIHRRNQDARFLYRQLARLNLTAWSTHWVDYLRPEELPDRLLFPLGHPILGQTYRRHPIQERRQQYYPVTRYFAMLLEEREQALLALMSELGATRVAISPVPMTSELDCKATLASQLQQKIFKYPKRPLPDSIDLQRHPWLAGEPTWQGIVRERLTRGVLSAQFELDLDVVGLLKNQIRGIQQLVESLSSMNLPDDFEETLRVKILKTRLVQVEFSEVPAFQNSPND